MNQNTSSNWQSEIYPAQTAFFLDVDGTLLDFKERPEDVVADAGLIELLDRLKRVSQGAVALVSGRMVADLDRIMAPLVLPAGGVHGADLRLPDGRRETLEGEALAEIRQAVMAFVNRSLGLRFEDKGGATFAVHFRQAPDKAEDVARFLGEQVQGTDLMVQHGKMVAEVKAKTCHKGFAIGRLTEVEPFAGRIPLFIGDDLTDEHGFQAVNAKSGISVKVGDADEQTVAHYRLADTRAVRGFLEMICRSGEEDK